MCFVVVSELLVAVPIDNRPNDFAKRIIKLVALRASEEFLAEEIVGELVNHLLEPSQSPLNQGVVLANLFEQLQEFGFVAKLVAKDFGVNFVVG